MGNKTSSRDYDPQEILNAVFDTVGLLKQQSYESDGTNDIVVISKLVAKKITTSGDDTYVGIAPIGTAQTTSGWQCKKISVSGATTTVTWADGNANFDNVATDLTSLTYS